MGTRKTVTEETPAVEVAKTPRAKKAPAKVAAAKAPAKAPAKKAPAPKSRNPLRKNTPGASRKRGTKPLAELVPAPPTLAEELGLSQRDALFADFYLTHFNASRAYHDAGFESKSDGGAACAASRLIRRPNVAEYVRRRGKAMIDRVEEEQDKLLTILTYTAYADANELMEHRLDCCRFCYGEGHQYQFTPQEFARYEENFDKAVAEAIENKTVPPEFDPRGGVGFSPNHEPNAECPECFGRGIQTPVFKDTRYLSPAAQALYAGFKETKDGFEIKTNSQEKARETLAKIRKLYDDNTKVEVSFDVETLDERFAKKMAEAHLRMKAMHEDRKSKDD